MFVGARNDDVSIAPTGGLEVELPRWTAAPTAGPLALFAYDGASGDWIPAGSVSEASDEEGRPVYKARAGRFGWFAVAEFFDALTCVEGCAVDMAGGPLAGIDVAAVGVDHFSETRGTTDEEGCFELEVRANAQLRVEVVASATVTISRVASTGAGEDDGCTSLGTLHTASEPQPVADAGGGEPEAAVPAAEAGGEVRDAASDASVVASVKVANPLTPCSPSDLSVCSGASPICQTVLPLSASPADDLAHPAPGACTAPCTRSAECGPNGSCAIGEIIAVTGTSGMASLGPTGYCSLACTLNVSGSCPFGYRCLTLNMLSASPLPLPMLDQPFCHPVSSAADGGGGAADAARADAATDGGLCRTSCAPDDCAQVPDGCGGFLSCAECPAGYLCGLYAPGKCGLSMSSVGPDASF
jgi:hypothetical protein